MHKCHTLFIALAACCVPTVGIPAQTSIGSGWAFTCPDGSSPATDGSCPRSGSSGGQGAANWDNAAFFRNLGRLFTDPFGMQAQAARQAQAKRSQASNRATARNNEGLAAWNARDYATAREKFAAALRDDPNDAVIRRNLASAWRAIGWEYHRTLNYAEAIRSLRQAVTIDPSLTELTAQLEAVERQYSAQLAAAQLRQSEQAAAAAERQRLRGLADQLAKGSQTAGTNASGLVFMEASELLNRPAPNTPAGGNDAERNRDAGLAELKAEVQSDPSLRDAVGDAPAELTSGLVSESNRAREKNAPGTPGTETTALRQALCFGEGGVMADGRRGQVECRPPLQIPGGGGQKALAAPEAATQSGGEAAWATATGQSPTVRGRELTPDDRRIREAFDIQKGNEQAQADRVSPVIAAQREMNRANSRNPLNATGRRPGSTPGDSKTVQTPGGAPGPASAEKRVSVDLPPLDAVPAQDATKKQGAAPEQKREPTPTPKP